MDDVQAAAMGYIGAIEIRVPSVGEPVQVIYPLAGRCVEDLEPHAIATFNRFWELGPEADGWGAWTTPDFDGVIYQLLTREVVLPDMDSLDEADPRSDQPSRATTPTGLHRTGGALD